MPSNWRWQRLKLPQSDCRGLRRSSLSSFTSCFSFFFLFPPISHRVVVEAGGEGESEADSLRKSDVLALYSLGEGVDNAVKWGDVAQRERERERAWGKQSTGHAYGPLLVSFSTAFLLTTYGPSQPRLMAPLPIRMGKAAVTKHAQGHWPGNVAPTQQAYSLAPTGFIWPGECEHPPPTHTHPRLTSTSYHAAHNPSAYWQCYYCPKMRVWDAQSKYVCEHDKAD